MSPRDLFILSVVLALFLAVARWRGGGLLRRGPKRVRHDTLEEQVDADFPPGSRDEAKALLESVLAEAKPENRELVWKRVLDGSRGDIARLRKLAPKTVESLRKIYRLFGEPVEGPVDAPRA